MYLGACRKGQKDDSLMKQPNSKIGAPRRAFSLKMAYMRTILNYVQKSGESAVSNFKITASQLVPENALRRNSFENVILKRFKPFLNKSFEKIAKRLSVNLTKNPKNKFAIVANAILGNALM